MSPFWKGFFSIFEWPSSRKSNYDHLIPKPFEWYHKGEWWEHPIYGDGFKNKKKDRD